MYRGILNKHIFNTCIQLLSGNYTERFFQHKNKENEVADSFGTMLSFPGFQCGMDKTACLPFSTICNDTNECSDYFDESNCCRDDHSNSMYEFKQLKIVHPKNRSDCAINVTKNNKRY